MLAKVEPELTKALAADNYTQAMQRMAALRPAVDAFLDKIRVNADDAALRLNRLRLLSKLRAATAGVADLSRVAG
jgi:glycyl-tRNA synthetase beta chain